MKRMIVPAASADVGASVVPAAIAAVLATTSLALADQATGTVKSFDSGAMTLILQDGTTYYLPKNFKNPGLKSGEQVRITWAMQNGRHVASDVSIQ